MGPVVLVVVYFTFQDVLCCGSSQRCSDDLLALPSCDFIPDFNIAVMAICMRLQTLKLYKWPWNKAAAGIFSQIGKDSKIRYLHFLHQCVLANDLWFAYTTKEVMCHLADFLGVFSPSFVSLFWRFWEVGNDIWFLESAFLITPFKE